MKKINPVLKQLTMNFQQKFLILRYLVTPANQKSEQTVATVCLIHVLILQYVTSRCDYTGLNQTNSHSVYRL
jgi:hypothetical protein